MIKTLPLNRTRPLFSAFGPQPLNPDPHPVPFTMQRRSSFQAATKLNGLDFYAAQEPFYLIDRQTMKMNQRNNYSPERDLRERENYREKRREYSPYAKDDHLVDLHRQNHADRNRSRENSLVMENHLLTTNERLSAASSTNEQQWREMNAIEEVDYQDRYIDSNDNDRDELQDDDVTQIRDNDDDDKNQFNGGDDDRDRVSIDYQRDDETTFVNYDRDDDRYRDDGIFV